MIVQENWILKCSYYYELKEIISTLPNVTPHYIVGSNHPDYIIIEKFSKNINTQ